MTLQEIFSMAYVGLRNQGFERSVDEMGRCMYRGAHGYKCAIGHCIPDKEYDDRLEGLSIRSNIIMNVIGASKEVWTRLMELQSIHDLNENPKYMRMELLRFAKGYGLEVPA